MSGPPIAISLRPGNPDFLDLPWGEPLSAWEGRCPRLEEVPRGLSRHPVVFVNYAGVIYALKELPPRLAEMEYNLLRQIEDLRLPVVTAVGHTQTETTQGKASVLITRYLDRSLPYRSLFMRGGLRHFREGLLDAMAGLMVQLNLTGVYWGDCSLSNVLFRRDAGALQAYLVDAETAEVHAPPLPPTLRHHDLEIMDENVTGELKDLAAAGEIPEGISIFDTGAYIKQRYQSLWEEITREEIISPAERYRIHERIRALNALGFSVGEVELQAAEDGERIRLRVVVTDRNFHREQLYGLTGIEAEEMQARKMMSEIQEIKATLAQRNNRSTPLSAAAYHWLEHLYQPVVAELEPLMDQYTSQAELYCQVLEHKWFLSEKERRDVGHQVALQDFLARFAKDEDTGGDVKGRQAPKV